MNVEMRDATAEDYDAILDLDREHKILDGNDYIPATFHKYLQDPDRKIQVFLRHGKIVS